MFVDVRASSKLKRYFDCLKLCLSRQLLGEKEPQTPTENDLERGDNSKANTMPVNDPKAEGASISDARREPNRNLSTEHYEANQCNETKKADDTPRRITVVRDLDPAAPNISLNCHYKLGRAEIICVAAVGTIIQIGVLVFCGFITLHSSIAPQFPKNNRPAQGYALPCTIGGTILLTIGILVCGIVVEQSTTETYFKANKQYSIYLVWLQKGSTVNDQDFKPFAIFPTNERPYIAVSRRRHKAKGKNGKRELKTFELSPGNHIDNTPTVDISEQTKVEINDENSTFGLETLTTTGCVIALAGFVLQFMGLRGMSWVASVVQLGAMGVMTILRAWVRRGLAEAPGSVPLTPNFELDWFAHSLFNHRHAGWINQRGKSLSTHGIDVDRRGIEHTVFGVEHDRLSQPTKVASATGTTATPTPQAGNILMIRRELGKLADWRGPASNQAIILSEAMEVVAEGFLLPPSEGQGPGGQTLAWTFEKTLDNQKFLLSFGLQYKDGEWRARADELEAALSLWLSSIWSQKHTPDDKALADSDGWLRIKRVRQLGLRLYGPVSKKDALMRDLRLWIPENVPRVFKVEEAFKGGPADPFERISLPNYRVVGYDIPSESAQRVCNNEDSFNILPDSPSFGASHMNGWAANPPNDRVLAVKTHDSLEKLLARDLFFTFWESIVHYPRVEWETEATELSCTSNDRGWRKFKLRNGMLTELIGRITNTGFLLLPEAYFDVITPLSMKGLLPNIHPLVRDMEKQASKFVVEGQWEQLYFHLRSMFNLALTYDVIDSPTRPRILAICHYYVEIMGWMKKMAETERGGHAYYNNRPPGDLAKYYKECLEEPAGIESGSSTSRVLDGQSSIWTSDSSIFALTKPLRIEPADQKRFRLSKHHVLALGVEGPRWWFGERDVLWKRDSFDWTPIHYLAALGDYDTLSHGICEEPITKGQVDCFGLAPLHYACARGHAATVKAMLEARSPINVVQDNGTSPMHIAAFRGHVGIVKLLLKYSKLAYRRETLGEYLRPSRVENTTSTQRSFFDRAPIHWAAMGGHVELVQLLKADLHLEDQCGWTCFHLAVIYGQTELVKALVREGEADLNRPGHDNRTPLHLAVDKMNKEVIHLLLERDVDINTTSSVGLVPFHQAVYSCDRDTIEMMISKGARMDMRDTTAQKMTVLHHLAARGDPEILDLLLETGEVIRSIIRLRNSEEETALHIAVSRSRRDEYSDLDTQLKFRSFVKVLMNIMESEDINATNHRGDTVLHVAVRGGKLPLAEALLDGGAKPSLFVRNIRNMTPLDMARYRERRQKLEAIELGRQEELPYWETALAMVQLLEKWQ